MSAAGAVLIGSVLVLAYVFAGYPLALRLLVRVRGPRAVAKADVTPTVTLIISAYNEQAVIAAKLENALALDYPADLLDIVVISDASDDRTDAIAGSFASRGVRLRRQEERRGKTAGLNAVVPTLASEIVVFSDANAMYEPDAIRRLVRNFADPSVGCVTGEARYVAGGPGAADRGERLYWDYEIQIKRLETAVGSMVGGDGAIYAIRRALWHGLPEDAINDFLNPLQIVAAGHRAVYEPEAVCHEETAGDSRQEYRRRVRIVSRSWRAVFQAPQVLNPFRVGLFAWSVVSHKVLRWFSGVFVLASGAALVAIGVQLGSPQAVGAASVAGALGLVVAVWPAARRGAKTAGYFAVINVASLVGIARGSVGAVSGVWAPLRAAGSARRARPIVPMGPLFLSAFALWIATSLVLLARASAQETAVLVFWTSIAVQVYVLAGYPLVLSIARTVAPKPVRRRANVFPSVTVLIAANDEEKVIEAKLENTLAIDYPPDRLEVVVASDGSVDGTNAIVRRFAPRVRLLELSPRRGKAAAIGAGMTTVSSEIVAFSDANTFVESGALRALVENFGDPDVGAVSGDVTLEGERAALGPSEDLYYRYERWVQKAESEVGSMIGVDGALYAIRRSLFVPPADDTVLDDMAIPMAVVRAGSRVVFEPRARAHEQGSETATEEFSRKARVIAGAVQFLTRRASGVPADRPQVIFSLVSHKGLRWLTPIFLTGAFLASVVLSTTSQAYAVVATAQGILLTAGLAGCVPAIRRAGFVAAAHYFCLVQAAAAVGVLRGLSGRQSVLWRRFVHLPTSEAAGPQ